MRIEIRHLYEPEPFQGVFPLHDAAGRGDIREIEALLRNGADIDQEDANGETPLLTALRKSRSEAAHFLLDNQACPGKCNLQTLLKRAVLCGSGILARILPFVTLGETDPPWYVEPLKEAVFHEDFLNILIVLRNFNWGSSSVRVPRSQWVGRCYRYPGAVFKYSHIEAQIKKFAVHVNFPLSIDVKTHIRTLEIFDFLIENVDDPGRIYADFKETILSALRKIGYLREEEELLGKFYDRGFFPIGPDIRKNTPLHLASQRGFVRLSSRLLEKGANPNARNDSGNTPLHFADLSHLPLIKLLISYGGNMDEENDSGITPRGIFLKKYEELPDFSEAKEEVYNLLSELGLMLQ